MDLELELHPRLDEALDVIGMPPRQPQLTPRSGLDPALTPLVPGPGPQGADFRAISPAFCPVLGQGALAFAIANDADSDASRDFVLESPDRLNLGQETIAVTSKSKVVKFLSEVIQIPAGFTGGSATVSCDQKVSIIGLQIYGTVFTTLPPAILSITPEPTS